MIVPLGGAIFTMHKNNNEVKLSDNPEIVLSDNYHENWIFRKNINLLNNFYYFVVHLAFALALYYMGLLQKLR